MRLQETCRNRQLVLAETMRRPGPGPTGGSLVRRLGTLARRRSGAAAYSASTTLPLGRPGAVSLLHNAVRPQSRLLLVLIRVAVASVIAGALGLSLGLSHSFWTVAAAVCSALLMASPRSYAAHPAGRAPPTGAGLRELAEAVRLQQRPGVSYDVPSFIFCDVADLRRALRG